MQNQIKNDYAPDFWRRYEVRKSKTGWLVLIGLVVAVFLVYLSFHRLNQFFALYEEAMTHRAEQIDYWAKRVEVIDVKTLPAADAIRYVAQREHYGNSEYLVALAECESSLRPSTLGDFEGRARGLYQIRSDYWPEVSDETAFDVEASTLWTIEKLRENKNLWPLCQKKIGKKNTGVSTASAMPE